MGPFANKRLGKGKKKFYRDLLGLARGEGEILENPKFSVFFAVASARVVILSGERRQSRAVEESRVAWKFEASDGFFDCARLASLSAQNDNAGARDGEKDLKIRCPDLLLHAHSHAARYPNDLLARA